MNDPRPSDPVRRRPTQPAGSRPGFLGRDKVVSLLPFGRSDDQLARRFAIAQFALPTRVSATQPPPLHEVNRDFRENAKYCYLRCNRYVDRSHHAPIVVPQMVGITFGTRGLRAPAPLRSHALRTHRPGARSAARHWPLNQQPLAGLSEVSHYRPKLGPGCVRALAKATRGRKAAPRAVEPRLSPNSQRPDRPRRTAARAWLARGFGRWMLRRLMASTLHRLALLAQQLRPGGPWAWSCYPAFRGAACRMGPDAHRPGLRPSPTKGRSRYPRTNRRTSKTHTTSSRSNRSAFCTWR